MFFYFSHSAIVSNFPSSRSFDVLVVGGGAAGLYAALSLPSHYRVGLIAKDGLSLSASEWAQGGLAAAIAPDDSPRLHLEDTLQAGAGLCDPEAVQLLVEQGPDCVQALLHLGVTFDRKAEGLALTLEAAHSRRRVLHAADTTGRAVVSALTAAVLQRSNVEVLAPAFVLDLWMDEADRCRGVSLVQDNQLEWIAAGAVVLATGGGGQVFAQTTNPALSTGDGVAIAWRAGALLRDLEFVQFHPTALTQPGAPRFLISEAVRGEGAHLLDDQGHRFAFEYDPAGELAPRDVVSRAIFNHLQKTSRDPAIAHVWLDLRPIPPERIRHRFPNIIQVCQRWGIDVFQAPIPVAPAAHYWMGGIWTGLDSQTSIPNLYAVGEVSSTGVHGANRLASNSLLECIVFGAQLNRLTLPPAPPAAAPALRLPPGLPRTATDWHLQQSQLEALRQTLPKLVWQSAGICREGETMAAAIAQLQTLPTPFVASPQDVPFPPPPPCSLDLPEAAEKLRFWGETRNLLAIAQLILKSAEFRTESRGGHYRSDYPQPDPAWQVHTWVKRETWWRSPSPQARDLHS